MPTATLTSKGQTTVPREIRQSLKLKSGDRIEFQLNPDGKTATLRPANIPLAGLRALLKRKGMKPYNPAERRIAAGKHSGKRP